MKNPAPYRYDIVGSFLRTAAIHEARARFESGAISAKELAQVEDAEIRTLVQKEETVGRHRRRVPPLLLALGLSLGADRRSKGQVGALLRGL